MIQGKICAQFRARYRILHNNAEYDARVSGHYMHRSSEAGDYPVVGDDVLFSVDEAGSAVIHELVPRRNAVFRKSAGANVQAQPIAANLDYLLIVCGLDAGFNVRRIERYIALARSSGVAPVVVLNKSDLCEDPAAALEATREATQASSVPVHVLSALDARSPEQLIPYIKPGKTLALVGSSGAGKSTLTNALLGTQAQRTSGVRASDGRGRHTTVHRELFALPQGAFLIDTPGMRELQLWETGDALEDVFSDIEAAAGRCRFSDCAHEREPGCALRAALDAGEIDAARFANYQKLAREAAFLERKRDSKTAAAQRSRARFKRRQS